MSEPSETVSADILHILLVEDDPVNLKLLLDTLPKALAGYILTWDPCDSFVEACQRVEHQRYDIIVTDVYRDRKGQKKSSLDVKADLIMGQIINRRFCPVVLFSDGPQPPSIEYGPFVRFADKSDPAYDQIVAELEAIINTGVPIIAQALHDELDRVAGSYLWQFLMKNWDDLVKSGVSERDVLERIVRRRAAIQLSRLDSGVEHTIELESVEGGEFYIYPPIAGDEYRMGEIIRHKKTGEFRVLLTPHCHLTVQKGDLEPRSEFVLIVKTLDATETIRKANSNPWPGRSEKRLKQIRRRITSPADDMGSPAKRYWFLPEFLKIPDLYCDFLQLESVALGDLQKKYERVAVLDTPFAEALQSSFTGFYSAVGLPGLKPERFEHLVDAASGQADGK